MYPRGGKGKYWTAAYVYNVASSFGPVVDFFCSYANDPSVYNIKFPFPIKNINVKVVQPTTSETCGLFTLYVLCFRSRGVSFSAIVDRFTASGLERNDYIVKQFYKNVKKLKINPLDIARLDNQKCCTRLCNKF